jgi:predicted permease
MNFLRRDLRYALRILCRNPGFTAIIVLVLALGVGANTAIYSIVDAVLFRPLPGRNPHQLVRLYTTAEKGRAETTDVSFPIFKDYRDHLRSFSGMAAYRTVKLEVAHSGGIAERLDGGIASSSFFHVLGVSALCGRLFSDADDSARGSNPVIVLSERFWRREFNGRPDAVGSPLRVNGQSFTVIGVAPASLQEIERGPQVWLPLSMAFQAEPMLVTQIDRLENSFFRVVARLGSGVSLPQAQAELDVISERLGSGQTVHLWEGIEGEVVAPSKSAVAPAGQWEEYDWKRPWAVLAPATKGFTPEEGRLSWLLLGVALLVLLIATADVAGLWFARAEHEEKEFAIRSALGASRWDLLRQRLVQGLLLAAAGALAGLLVASWVASLLFAAAPEGLPLPVGVASSPLSFRVVLFVAVVAFASGVIFSLLPSLGRWPRHLFVNLKLHAGGEGRSSRLQSVLVLVQIASSVVLLVGAGLLIQTMRNVAHIDLGFDTEHVLSATLDFSRQGYSKSGAATMLVPLLEKARSIPGADSVALVAGGSVEWRSRAANRQASVCGNLPIRMVSPSYFETLRIPLVGGRDFSTADSKDAPGVAIVNQAAAKLCWPNRNPVGVTLPNLGILSRSFEIVGVAGNVRVDELEKDAHPQIYAPIAQFFDAYPWQFPVSILVRTSLLPHALVSALDSSVRGLDSNLLLFDVRTPRELLEQSYRREAFFLRVLGMLGPLAFVLAVAGLYGLLAFLTAKRAREFGIRMALGAVPRQIFRLVLVRGGVLTIGGLVVGLVASAASAHLLRSVLFGVSPSDPRVLFAVAALFLIVGLLACLWPARRATSLDPMAVLRDE